MWDAASLHTLPRDGERRNTWFNSIVNFSVPLWMVILLFTASSLVILQVKRSETVLIENVKSACLPDGHAGKQQIGVQNSRAIDLSAGCDVNVTTAIRVVEDHAQFPWPSEPIMTGKPFKIVVQTLHGCDDKGQKHFDTDDIYARMFGPAIYTFDVSYVGNGNYLLEVVVMDTDPGSYIFEVFVEYSGNSHWSECGESGNCGELLFKCIKDVGIANQDLCAKVPRYLGLQPSARDVWKLQVVSMDRFLQIKADHTWDADHAVAISRRKSTCTGGAHKGRWVNSERRPNSNCRDWNADHVLCRSSYWWEPFDCNYPIVQAGDIMTRFRGQWSLWLGDSTTRELFMLQGIARSGNQRLMSLVSGEANTQAFSLQFNASDGHAPIVHLEKSLSTMALMCERMPFEDLPCYQGLVDYHRAKGNPVKDCPPEPTTIKTKMEFVPNLKRNGFPLAPAAIVLGACATKTLGYAGVVASTSRYTMNKMIETCREFFGEYNAVYDDTVAKIFRLGPPHFPDGHRAFSRLDADMPTSSMKKWFLVDEKPYFFRGQRLLMTNAKIRHINEVTSEMATNAGFRVFDEYELFRGMKGLQGDSLHWGSHNTDEHLFLVATAANIIDHLTLRAFEEIDKLKRG